MKAGRVSVIPPNANIEAIDTHLRLSELGAERRRRAPIDHFFRTLSAAWATKLLERTIEYQLRRTTVRECRDGGLSCESRISWSNSLGVAGADGL